MKKRIKQQQDPPWSEDDFRFLDQHYPYTSARYVANALDRTVGAVKFKAHKRKIKKIRKMPQIQKTHILDVTPQQFVDACSLTELQELQLIIDPAIARKQRDENQKNQQERIFLGPKKTTKIE